MNIPFAFPVQTIEAYSTTAGGCLALALHKHFGLSIYALQRSTAPGASQDARSLRSLASPGDAPIRYVASLGDAFIDIAGIRDRESLKRAAGGPNANLELVPVSPVTLGNPDYAKSITPGDLEKATAQAAVIMRRLHELGAWPRPDSYSWPEGPCMGRRPSSAYIRLLAAEPKVGGDFLLSQSPYCRKSKRVFLAWRYADGEEVVIKIVGDSPSSCESLADVLETHASMGRLGVTVPVYLCGSLTERLGFVVMRKADACFSQVLGLGAGLIAKVREKVQLMHEHDIAHGDLHHRNLVCSRLPEDVEVYIIDFDSSFHISRGATPGVRQWMETGYGWEGTFADFVAHDFRNWADDCMRDQSPRAVAALR